MRSALYVSLCWGLSMGLAACDSSEPRAPKVPVPIDAGDSDEGGGRAQACCVAGLSLLSTHCGQRERL